MNLFKKKQGSQKAKKGISALVLASGMAALVSYPSFFSHLPFTSQSKLEKTAPTSLSTGLAASRRAKSMSNVHKQSLSSSPPSNPSLQMVKHTVTFSEDLTFRQPVSLPVFEDDMDDFEIEERRPERVTPLVLEKRRVVSAPSVYLSNIKTATAIPDLLDDLLDFEDDDQEWVVSSVKAKAVQEPLKQMQREKPVETWDDDFEETDWDGEGLKVPKYLQDLQVNLKIDMLNMRKFALHIQDLKLIYLDAKDIETGLKNDVKDIGPLLHKYETILSYASTLIDIAECTDPMPNASSSSTTLDDNDISPKHMHILANILAGPGGLDGLEKAGLNGPCLGDLQKDQLREMLKDGNLNFGNEWMPTLLVRISPIKLCLAEYLTELRSLSLSPQ